jgi:hypothetical protein
VEPIPGPNFRLSQLTVSSRGLLDATPRSSVDRKNVLGLPAASILSPAEGGEFGKMSHKLLKHNINILDLLILCATKGSTGHLEKGLRSQQARVPQDASQSFTDCQK